MKHYAYTGLDPIYIGHTALGHPFPDGFKIQVDDPAHDHAYSWHKAERLDWREDVVRHELEE